MAPPAFWIKYLARMATLAAVRDVAQPRDRLSYFERAPPWRPEQGLAAFVAELVEDQGLAREAPQIRAFLDFWLPRQALAGRGLALIEFSFTTDAPGFGMMLYGDNRAIGRGFREWCRRDGLAAEVADRCAAICETFAGSELSMVRAEFCPGEPTRTSLASSWFLDPWRRTGGFAAHLQRLPPAQRDPGLVARVAALEQGLAPDFSPLFFGFSVDDGVLDPKLSFVRYAQEAPLARGGAARRLLAGLPLDETRQAGVVAAYRRLWEASSEPMTQLLLSVPPDEAEPRRINLITCGTRTGAVKDLLDELGDPRSGRRSVDSFERAMQTGRAKYVALRVTPEGLSPRVKLYGQACFALGR